MQQCVRAFNNSYRIFLTILERQTFVFCFLAMQPAKKSESFLFRLIPTFLRTITKPSRRREVGKYVRMKQDYVLLQTIVGIGSVLKCECYYAYCYKLLCNLEQQKAAFQLKLTHEMKISPQFLCITKKHLENDEEWP